MRSKVQWHIGMMGVEIPIICDMMDPLNAGPRWSIRCHFEGADEKRAKKRQMRKSSVEQKTKHHRLMWYAEDTSDSSSLRTPGADMNNRQAPVLPSWHG